MALGTGVLIVDDDEGIRKTLSEVLEEEGFSVESVASGKEAIRAASKRMFDVALIDIRLPDMDGTKLLDLLKEAYGPRMVRIIITGHPDLTTAVEAVNKCADGYVFKPIDVSKLVKLIRERLNRETVDYIRTHVPKNYKNGEEQRDGFWSRVAGRARKT